MTSPPANSHHAPQPPGQPPPGQPPPGQPPPAPTAHAPAPPPAPDEDPVRPALQRLERGLQHVESRIDRLYIAVGGGTILLAAIGLAAGFIARSAG